MLVSIPHKFKQPNIFSDRFKINFLLVIQKSGNSNYETDLVFYMAKKELASKNLNPRDELWRKAPQFISGFMS